MRFRFLTLALAAVLMTAGFARAASVVISTTGSFSAGSSFAASGYAVTAGAFGTNSITITRASAPAASLTFNFTGIGPTLFSSPVGISTINVANAGLFFGTWAFSATGTPGTIGTQNPLTGLLDFTLAVTQIAPGPGSASATGVITGTINGTGDGTAFVVAYNPAPFFPVPNFAYTLDQAQVDVGTSGTRQTGSINTPPGTPNIVPVPPAVFAGLGLMGLVGAIRSRRQA